MSSLQLISVKHAAVWNKEMTVLVFVEGASSGTKRIAVVVVEVVGRPNSYTGHNRSTLRRTLEQNRVKVREEGCPGRHG